ncbi:hybrid sensor histidine kinase/response regulator [Myxosarcina sp. GI1]|uniref:hybrid sensor histidine kinase/response regulator n=1 Tax=Myxosarcina sp. GI1 TaxID=1541065 RepID=UPI00055F8B14|nr:hybrid sensor histidine kinase/response regulator [Myxosarcina sp. GI1]
MIIEDDELRDLYKTSSSEHLQKLEAELMQLEKNPQDTAALEEFLREAHTLKGDSRMLGLNDIEMLVHQLEDCLTQVKQGARAIDSQLCDRLYQGLDAIDKLATEAVTGKAANVNTFEVLAALIEAESYAANSDELVSSEPDFGGDSNTKDALFDDSNLFADDEELFNEADCGLESSDDSPILELSSVEKTSLVSTSTAEPTIAAVADRELQIDSIRVEPRKLDILMTQASELAVAKLRVSRQTFEIEKIFTLWEEWEQNARRDRQKLARIEKSLTREQLLPIQHLFQKTQERFEYFGNLIESLKLRADEDVASLSIIAEQLEAGIQNLRLLPLSTVFNIFNRMVRDLAKQQQKQIDFIVEGADTKADKQILEAIKDPLLHLIRNAIDHGIETPQERERKGKAPTATLRLQGKRTGNSIVIEVSDDGRGLDLDSIKKTALRKGIHTEAELAAMSEERVRSLIFASGFSTRTKVSELSGRGVGLDVVRANIEKLKGAIEVNSTRDRGCQFRISLNNSLATTSVIIVEVAQTAYAIPIEYVRTMRMVSRQDIFTIEGSQAVSFEGQPISIFWLADILQLSTVEEIPTTGISSDDFACVIVQVGSNYLALVVDLVVERLDIVLKPQSKLVRNIRGILGATILDNGNVCMVLSPPGLIEGLKNTSVAPKRIEQKSKKQLLLVEDSIIIRTQMKRLLQGANYEVAIAVDGAEGFQKLQQGNFDAVVSDVEMPNMNGFELTTRIRQLEAYNELPIILVTTLASAEDKRRGAEAGANAYLTKGDFDQKLLLETLQRLA